MTDPTAKPEPPLAEQIGRIPFAKLLGIDLTFVSKERAEARFKVGPEHCNPMGTIHGGATISIADTLGAMCAYRNLPEGANGTTTLESKTNFLGPARAGEIVLAVCTAIHVGKRTSIWQTKLATEAGKPVALVTQTQMTL